MSRPRTNSRISSTRIRSSSDPKGHRRWSDHEVDKVLTSAPREIKTGVLLGLYTGQRMSDVLKFKFGDFSIRDGAFKVRQQKTGRLLTVPIHEQLRRHLDQEMFRRTPKWDDWVVADAKGNRYSTNAFRHMFLRWKRTVGLDGLPFHGLRKTMAARLCEAGATPHEIMSIGGWTSSRYVDIYTQAAKQEVLARSAMKRLGGGDHAYPVVTHDHN